MVIIDSSSSLATIANHRLAMCQVQLPYVFRDSSTLPHTQVKKQQQKMTMILDAKKIKYEAVDVAASEEAKMKMREISGNPKALPPQICNGDKYCGVSDFRVWYVQASMELMCPC